MLFFFFFFFPFFFSFVSLLPLQMRVLLLIVLVALCAVEAKKRVFGGKQGSRRMFPWQIFLIIRGSDGRTFTCGGTILDSMHVLSAAHCFDASKNPAGIFVVVGENMQTGEGITYNRSIASVVIHPDRVEGNPNYDLAMLTLRQPIDLTSNPSVCRAIPLATSRSDIPQRGELVMVSGFGRTEAGYGSPTILFTNQRIGECPTSEWSPAICTEGVDENDQAASACHGDSGGPLIFNQKLIGAVSQGRDCVGYTAYASVPFNINWIRSEIARPNSGGSQIGRNPGGSNDNNDGGNVVRPPSNGGNVVRPPSNGGNVVRPPSNGGNNGNGGQPQWFYYRIRQGDYAPSVAARFGMDYQAFVRTNYQTPFVPGNTIRIFGIPPSDSDNNNGGGQDNNGGQNNNGGGQGNTIGSADGNDVAGGGARDQAPPRVVDPGTSSARTHRVRAGDTLFALARMYFPNMSPAQGASLISRANGNVSSLRPGQIVTIPSTR